MSSNKKNIPVVQNRSYAETTLIEDVLEANRHVGEHIDSITRRSTLIHEQLASLHPEITIRMIRRVLTKDLDKAG
jgi:hypothetical protein